MSDNKNKISKNEIKKKLAGATARKTLFLFLTIGVFLVILFGGYYILFRPYTITMDLNDGSGTVLTETYSIGSGKITLGRPKRNGFKFTGWTGTNVPSPNTDVVVGNGQIGNLSFVANWSDDLTISCQDWLIDAQGNRLENITDQIDNYLKAGNANTQFVDRKKVVKSGTEMRGASWGGDTGYNAYHNSFMYVGDSGALNVSRDNTIVYRYFYPVLDVNYQLDDFNLPNDAGIGNANVGTFDMYVDGELKYENITDFCGAIPTGSVYEIKPNQVYAGYSFVPTSADRGDVGTSREVATISFESHTGEIEVVCEDWVVDKKGNRVRNITGLVDQYLKKGSSSRGYLYKDRSVAFDEGDVVNAEDWGNDEVYGAYHDSFMYAGSSGDVKVKKDGTKVYRYFYPVLDLMAKANDTYYDEISAFASVNLYVDNELVEEDITDCHAAVPYGSNFKFEIKGYNNFSYVNDGELSGEMGYAMEKFDISFRQRTGDSFVRVEDWVVDSHGNLIKEITDDVDNFLVSGGSSRKYQRQDRNVIVSLEEMVDPAMFGNSIAVGAYSNSYVYAGASGRVMIDASGKTIYRYFYPILDINAQVGESKLGSANDIATFSVYADGKLAKIPLNKNLPEEEQKDKAREVVDFCYGVPANAEIEIKKIRTERAYTFLSDEPVVDIMDPNAAATAPDHEPEYTFVDDDEASFLMEDEPKAVYLKFSKEEIEELEED
jgi:uncharacterized repeat protein (TIGR02543 family)